MQAEEAVVQLAADPAVAYREFMYRPSGPLARWISDRFEVLARPGRPTPDGVRDGDVLIEVRLGRPGRGRCVRLDGREKPDRVLRPGTLLLRPRRLALLTDPEPAEPFVESAFVEHDFGQAENAGVRLEADAATPPFGRVERETVTEPLLGVGASAAAVAWTHQMYPAVSGVAVDDLRTALRDYVDLAAYLRLEQDPAGLLAVVRRGAGLVRSDETAEQVADRWRERIRLDRKQLVSGDFDKHDPPERGFLRLPRDLVVALRDHGCLAWGAVDFGPGSRGSGDMMHFDARIGGIGERLARGDNYVPAAGHPCLAKATAETEEFEQVGPPDMAELTERIARSIGVWETNRGGDQPNPRESALDTVAGVRASMATIEQATMPYAITVLRRHKSLRDRAYPALTLRELNAADTRVAAVATLLAAVTAAAADGTTPAAFIARTARPSPLPASPTPTSW